MILIYQMLKVASQTWVNAAQTAEAAGLSGPVHVHFLSKVNLDEIAAIGAMTGRQQTIQNQILLRAMLRKGVTAHAAIEDARGRGETVRVLSGMRDPVARALSIVHFFADFYGDVSRPLDRFRGGDGATTAAAVLDWWRCVLDEVEPEDAFGRLMAFLIGRYRTWFAEELEAVLGVELGDTLFPAAEGAERLSGKGVEVLLYRVEDMTPGAKARSALLANASDFLGAAIGDLADVNTARTRRSFPRYREAQAALRLGSDRLDAIYSQPIVRRFYSETEIGGFKARWALPA